MRNLRLWLAATIDWRWLPALILLLGLAARLGWLEMAPGVTTAGGEIANVAVAFAETGTLSDSFRPGQGPTAHVLPVPPVYAGLIYRNFGARSPTSEAILAVSAIGVVLLGFALLFAIFAEAGTPRWARLLALAAAALLPLNFAMETITFRIWEGALVTTMALAYLLALIRLDRRRVIDTATVAALAAGAAIIAFSSPPLGLGIYACTFLLLVERVPVARWPMTVGLAALMLTLVIGPWAMRNVAAVGAPVLLRSNAGLEFALGNHPAAVAPTDERRTFLARLKEIHPFESDTAFAAMKRAGGEVPYAKALGAQAGDWATAHPGDFIRLSLRHIREYFFPPAWQWNIYSDVGRGVVAKMAVNWLITALGIAGAIAGLVRAPRRYCYVVIMMLLPALPYAFVQPVLRYRYIMYGLTIFLAADFVAYLLGRLRGTVGASIPAVNVNR